MFRWLRTQLPFLRADTEIISPSKEDILLSLTTLDNWRRRHNKENIGFGYDQYKPNQKFHYPEAYALWGNGYVKLYQVTQRQEYLELAKKCANWLIENKNPNYENSSWGLPWEWNGRSKHFSYITTSTFVGNFLINLYKITKDDRYLNVAESVGDWIVKECGIEREKDEVWFYYSDHQSLHRPIFNAISMASGFFSKLYVYTKKDYYSILAQKSARYVMNRQNPNGSWYYGAESTHIDNVHTGFTIEGLGDVYFTLPSTRNKIRKVLTDSYKFYWTKLYTPEGFGREYISYVFFSKIKAAILHYDIETRLHGYASGIRAFTKLSKILKIQNKGLVIAKYIIKNLQAQNGAFRFTSKEDYYYIRNEAHIFDALATLISEFACD